MEIQARNAFLQRNLENDGEPRAEDWDDSPEGKLIAGLQAALDKMRKRLNALHRSVTFDPSAPLPKEDAE